MYTHSDALTTLFNLLNTLTTLITQLTDQQKAARKKGLELYHLGEYRDSEAYLIIAASAGDRESQFSLGEVIKRRDGSVTEDAKKWYALAAAQGDVYALLRLADEASLKQAKELAQERADNGNGEAMLQLYEMTKDIAWLKKSAEAGFQEGQYILARLYDSDEKLIPDAVERRTTINKWLKSAADAGFSLAMHWYSNRQPISLNLPERRSWVVKRAQLNDANALIVYGYGLSGLYQDDDGIDKEYGFEKDEAKGYGLLWLVTTTTREFKRYQEVIANVKTLESELTSEQIAAGKTFAEAWKSSHPAMYEARLTFSDIR